MRTTTLRSSISSFGPFCSNGSEPLERLALSGSEGALIEGLQEDDETATGR